MTQYMLSVFHADAGPDLTPEAMAASMRDVDALNAEMVGAGVWVFAGGLHNDSTASVLRVTDGTVVTTDGPYAETKERIGGFWIIKADDLDAALTWARKATVACAAPIEVRPFMEEPGA
ncbi:MAG TPA: YciI family protein [Candidatus Saccharimonadales bacterium]|nr:YciI family protein [Candidatus Saccharimonadales bacterium]